jgi:MFS family permease
MGIFFVWFSMTGSVFYWSTIYNNPDVLLWMTATYSSPAFFVQLLQAKYDFIFNQKYSLITAYRFRYGLLIGFLCIIALIIPFLPQNLALFLTFLFILGLCSCACYGSLFQIVALYPRRATTFLSLGYAFPGFLLLFISRGVFGVPPQGGEKELHVFFGIVLAMALLALFSAQFLLYISNKQLQVTATTVNKNPYEGEEKPPKRIKPNNFLILKQIWRSSVGIALLMISRVTVFTILFRVPSTFTLDDDRKGYSQTLVYINLCADLFGRLLTGILPKMPMNIASLVLLVGILIHFLSVILVLLYVYSGAIPISNVAAQVFLAIFATCTGFFQTQSYIYAAHPVDPVFRTQVGALMNVSTQVGNGLGFALSFLLRIL